MPNTWAQSRPLYVRSLPLKGAISPKVGVSPQNCRKAQRSRAGRPSSLRLSMPKYVPI